MTRTAYGFLSVLFILTGLRAWFVTAIELSPDEAYYWCWSQALSTGYYDHPPAVAWLIHAGTWILGDGEVGVRLGALVCGGLTSWILFVVIRRVTGSEGNAFWGGLLVATCPLLAVGSVIHTPDAPLMVSWMAAIWFALRAFERNRLPDWIGLGICVGLAVLSKSTGLLLGAGLLLFAVSCKAGRDCIRGTGPALAVLVAALVATPNFIWNLDHAGGSLAFQLAHAAGGPSFRPLGLLEFLAGQAGLIGPILWVGLAGFMLLAWRRRVRFGRAEAYLLWCLSGPILLLVAALSMINRVEANWPAAAYLAAVPGMLWAQSGGLWYLKRRRLWFGLALGTSLALTALIHLQALVPVLPLGPGQDPTERLRGWEELARTAVADADALDASLASEGYGPVSQLRFHSHRPVAYEASSTRRSQYDLWPADPLGQRVLFLQPVTSKGPPGMCATARERWQLLRSGKGPDTGKLVDFRFWVCEGVDGGDHGG